MTSFRMLIALSFAVPAAAETFTHDIDWRHAAAGRPLFQSLARHAVYIDGFAWPGTVVRVEIPSDRTAVDVEIGVSSERDAGGHPVRDARGRAIEIAPAALGEPRRTSEGYAYWLLPDGDVRGHRIAHVLVVPYRDDATGTRALDRFDLVLTTGATERQALVRRIDWSSTRAADERAVRALLDGEMLRAAPPAERASVPPELDPVLVEQVIVTTDALAPAFQELADIKTRSGSPTIVTTMEWITAGYEAIDDAARIRAYLRDAYLYQGLRYAILAGDTDLVPTRLAVNRFQSDEGLEVISDLYFSTLERNWNDDGDALLGEAPDLLFGIDGDDVDLYADIAIGRVPAGSIADAETFVTKWKSYTGNDPDTFRNDYQNRILSLGEVLFPSAWVESDGPGEIILDGADISESTLTIVPPAFETYRMYQYWNNPERPVAVPEIKSDVIDEINEGYGIVDHVGHGFRTVMSVGSGTLGNQDADGFVNTNAFSVLYAVNCTSGAISFDCIGEHLLNNPNGGVVASISSTDLDYPTVSDLLKYFFFTSVFTDGTTRIGDAFTTAHTAMLPIGTLSENSSRWTLMTHILMGDPAMAIWTGAPDSMEVAFEPTMSLGDGSFVVTVTDDEGPLAGAMVCLFKSDGYGVGTTDPSGSATIPFNPETVGTFRVTATSQNYVPFADSAFVVAQSAPVLRVEGWTVRDSSGGGSIGNGDGRPDAGESVVIDLSVRNSGGAAATGVDVTLHADAPFISVTDSTAFAALITSGGLVTIGSALTFDVPASLPDSLRHVVIPASFELTATEGSWGHPWRFSIYQRILDLTSLSWSLTGDDGDGVLESGEGADIFLTIENLGEAEAIAVSGLAAGASGGFVISSDTAVFGNVSSDGLVQGGPLKLVSTGGGEADLGFDFALTDTYGTLLLSRRLDIVAPAPPDTLTFDPSAESIRVLWPRPDADDLRGYHVYRSTSSGGPFSRITDASVDDGSFFLDTHLGGESTLFYYVTAVDSSGNESTASDTLSTSTAPPFLEGWPVILPSGLSKGSPTIADVDGDGSLEVLIGWKQPMIFTAQGGDFVDGDNDALTVGIFADLESGMSQFWNSPALADIDGDGVTEIVFAAWQVDDGGHLYVLDATGAVEPGWPQPIGVQPWSTPAIGELDGSPGMEIVVSSGAGGGTFRGALFGFNHDGTEIVDGDANAATSGIFHLSPSAQAKFMYGSPAVADLDADGDHEVIFLEKTTHSTPTHATLYAFDGSGSVLPGFPYDDPAVLGSTSSPAAADLDGDGDLEIVAITEDRVIVVHHDGTDVAGWPLSLPAVNPTATDIRDFLTSPAIGDVDGDGQLDIAFGWLDGNVYLLTGDGGAAHPGFPADVLDGDGTFAEFLRSPVLGNVDGDPEPEIIVTSGDARLVAVNRDGSIVPGFPITFAGTVWGSAALADLDGNGSTNLIVQSDAPLLSVFDLPAVPWVAEENPWPAFRRDTRKSGAYATPTALDVVADAPLSSTSRVLPPRPNPFSSGRVALPFEVASPSARVRIRVFDVTGREVRVLADGRFPAGRYRLSWDGRRSNGRQLRSGTYFVRTDIDGVVFGEKITLVR